MQYLLEGMNFDFVCKGNFESNPIGEADLRDLILKPCFFTNKEKT